jgi:hypothetical protein
LPAERVARLGQRVGAHLRTRQTLRQIDNLISQCLQVPIPLRTPGLPDRSRQLGRDVTTLRATMPTDPRATDGAGGDAQCPVRFRALKVFYPADAAALPLTPAEDTMIRLPTPVLLTCLYLSLGMVSRASADTFLVTATTSMGPGTLAQALLDAANTPGSHAIRFQLPPDSHITMLNSLPPVVSPELDIDGAGAPGLVLDGSGFARLFAVAAANRVFRLANMEVRGGFNTRAGGCLRAISPNTPAGASVILERVVMRGCEARRSQSEEFVEGGAASVENRSLTVLESQFFDNQAHTVEIGVPTRAAGGAISVWNGPSHHVTIQNSRFVGNRVAGATDSGQGCCWVQGGALDIKGAGIVTLTRNRFSNNLAETLDQSTPWGAVLNVNASTVLTGNLFVENHNAGSMIRINIATASAFAHVANNTLVANSTDTGAALHITSMGTTVIRNNSFLSWRSDAYPVAHLWAHPTGGGPGTLVLSHNVFGAAESRWPHPDRPICWVYDTVPASIHHNLVLGQADGCGPTQDPNLVSLRVDSLRDNGGGLETVSFFQDSPIIDGGNPLPPSDADTSRCTPEDARGEGRARDGDGDGIAVCDLGAWESSGEAALFRHDFEQVTWRPTPVPDDD